MKTSSITWRKVLALKTKPWYMDEHWNERWNGVMSKKHVALHGPLVMYAKGTCWNVRQNVVI